MSSFDCTSPAHLAVEESHYIVLVKESGTPGQSVLNGSGCYFIPCLYQRTMARTTQTLNRKAGTLAQIAKIGVPPARHTADERRCAAPDSNLRGSLQHRTLAQRHRLCDAARYARRPTA